MAVSKRRTVVIYNGDGYEKLGRVSRRHADNMVARGAAKQYDVRLHGDELVLESVQLIDSVDTSWMYDTEDDLYVSHALVRIRDRFTCGYCLEYGDTVDHILPASRGGSNTWINLVTACRACNGAKADMTPQEAGMVLRLPVYAPRDVNRWKIERAFGRH